MTRSVLMVTSQLPHDPASGAARSDRTTVDFLAAAGFRVRVLGTSATEQQKPAPAIDILRGYGITPRVEEGSPALGDRPVLTFEYRGASYTILDVGPHNPVSWHKDHHRQYTALLMAMIARETPDVAFGYGGQAPEVAWRTILRRAGAVFVFHLQNWGYLHPLAWNEVDAVITPSPFVTEVYRERIGLDSTPLPMPIDDDEVVAKERRPEFVTLINPSLEKGAAVFVRIAEEICRRRSDIPFLIINARRTAVDLVRMGLSAGFDLRRHRQIHYADGVTNPGEIYARTKVLLAPSVWPEPGGRVGSEGVLNGIPVVVSDRGGMWRIIEGGAFVLPLPRHLTPEINCPVTPREAEEWIHAVEMLFDDPDEYARATWRAERVARRLSKAAVAPLFADFYAKVQRRTAPLLATAPPKTP